jgi:hypothetical protein
MKKKELISRLQSLEDLISDLSTGIGKSITEVSESVRQMLNDKVTGTSVKPLFQVLQNLGTLLSRVQTFYEERKKTRKKERG